MAILTPQRISLTGAEITFAAAAGGGDSFPNSGNTVVLLKNASGAPITVTADCPNPDNFGVSGAALDGTVSVPAAAVAYAWGPFPAHRFNDSNGRVQLTYSGVTTFSVAVISR
jgi:hypothetical protein